MSLWKPIIILLTVLFGSLLPEMDTVLPLFNTFPAYVWGEEEHRPLLDYYFENFLELSDAGIIGSLKSFFKSSERFWWECRNTLCFIIIGLTKCMCLTKLVVETVCFIYQPIVCDLRFIESSFSENTIDNYRSIDSGII